MHHILQSAAAIGCPSSVDIVMLQACYSWQGSTLQIGSCAWQVLGEVEPGCRTGGQRSGQYLSRRRRPCS